MIGLRCIRDICKPDSGLACQIYSTIGQACPPSMMTCSCMYCGPMLVDGFSQRLVMSESPSGIWVEV